MKNIFNTEQEISDCYLEGVLKHSGSISGFIYVFTQLVKNAEGDGRIIMSDVDDAIARFLGELGASAAFAQLKNEMNMEPETNLDSMNLLYWMNHKPDTENSHSVEKAIVQAAENLADPNFFIAELSGILSALIELKSVCYHRREGTEES